jgi:hypothetical protein
MARGILGLVGSVSERFKRRFYGPTFRCPVCHLELAYADLDTNGLIVCPLCGVVLDVEAVYGHAVPVVLEVEVHRPQPKLRLHPLATHVPIGLFPFALLGAVILAAVSFLPRLTVAAGEWTLVEAPTVAGAVLVLLATSVGASLLTVASGLWDWFHRYRRRPYRQISVKIAGSIVFVALGAVALALQLGGWVFSATGLIDVGSPGHLLAALAYLAVLAVNMVVLATLGHIGGTLVFGR